MMKKMDGWMEWLDGWMDRWVQELTKTQEGSLLSSHQFTFPWQGTSSGARYHSEEIRSLYGRWKVGEDMSWLPRLVTCLLPQTKVYAPVRKSQAACFLHSTMCVVGRAEFNVGLSTLENELKRAVKRIWSLSS